MAMRGDGMARVRRRQQIDDRQTAGDHGVGSPIDPGEFGQLRQEDQDRQRIDEARNDRLGDELHQDAQTDIAGDDLQNPRQNRGREQILETVVAHEADHQQRHGAGRRRDHSGPAARERDHHADREGGVETDGRIDPGDDGEGDGFRDQRERHHNPGQRIAFDVSEPTLSECSKCH